MITKAAIDRFVEGRTLALVGVSAKGKGFGNAAYKELKARGYRVLPVHPGASSIQGDPCWPALSALPERVDRVLVVVDKGAAVQVVRDAAAAGIGQVWLQQGAESEAAIKACEDLHLEHVHGHCILMFAEPVGSVHRFHRWLWNVLGKAPSA